MTTQKLGKLLSRIGAIAFGVTLPLQAHALEMCGAEITTAVGDYRVHFGDATAMCSRHDNSCRVITYADKDNAHLRTTSASFRPSHYMAMSRKSVEQGYTLEIGSFQDRAAAFSGFELRVDRWLMQTHGENIISSQTVNQYQVTDLTYEGRADSLVEPFKRGIRFKWDYTVDNAAHRQSVSYSLMGMTKAFEWVDCFQRQRESGLQMASL